MGTKEKHSESIQTLETAAKEFEIVLHNDDVHTFDYVIEALVEVCNHSYIQAEQCTTIVHYKGKCTVQTGPFELLEKNCSKLLSLGLTAELL